MSGEHHIFVSVGKTATQSQEDFVLAVEARIRAEGFIPHTVGRDTFGSDSPLKKITGLMGRCSGAVIIALERSYFPSGVDRPGGPRQRILADIRLATPWNQIEAAMAYAADLPLLVILEEGVSEEGLLERGYDWYVQTVSLSPAALSKAEFNGILASWRQKVQQQASLENPPDIDPGKIPIGRLLASLNPGQLWSTVAALAALLAGAFALGAHLFTKK